MWPSPRMTVRDASVLTPRAARTITPHARNAAARERYSCTAGRTSQSLGRALGAPVSTLSCVSMFVLRGCGLWMGEVVDGGPHSSQCVLLELYPAYLFAHAWRKETRHWQCDRVETSTDLAREPHKYRCDSARNCPARSRCAAAASSPAAPRS